MKGIYEAVDATTFILNSTCLLDCCVCANSCSLSHDPHPPPFLILMCAGNYVNVCVFECDSH